MYLADNEESSIRGLSSNIDFSINIEMEKAKPGMTLECEVMPKSMECKILNGRKVNVKSILEVNAKIYFNEEIEFIENITNLSDIQKLNKGFNMNSLLGIGQTKAFAKDTIAIDGIDNLAEILKTSFRIINREVKVSYNKVLLKADIEVKIMYLTEDNRINCVKSKIPVIGFVDIQNVSDNNICDVKYEMKNLNLKPNNVDEHSIYVEIEIEMECKVYESKEVDLIEDLYSPSVELSSECKKIMTMQDKRKVQDVCNIRQKEIIQEIKNEKIYDTDIRINIQNTNVMNDRIIFEGEIEVNFIFSSIKTGGIDTKRTTIPFNYNMDIQGITKDCKLNTYVEAVAQDFIIMPDESLDIKIDLKFILDIFKNVNINLINNINVQENKYEEPHSIIIYYVKPGDTIWKIAKKFKSTVTDIKNMNEIEDENKINVGEQLFIPRYVPVIITNNT